MPIKKLTAVNFRNIKELTFEPSAGLNIIYGDNAKGKTNILEAIWLFTGAKSFRRAKDFQLIRRGQSFAKLTLEFFAKGRDQVEEIRWTPQKSYYLNYAKCEKISEFMGEFCAIVFSPEDLNLIKGGPDRRRDFLDIALGQIKPRYVPLMLEYNKILSQRNALLKDIGRFPSIIETLEIWDEAFVKIASILTHYRLRYTKILAPLAENFYSEMANKKESLKMIYSNADILNDMEIKDIKEYFKNTLIKNRALDIKTGFTQIGPHRDDFEITINDMSSKNFGSQGQQRSIVLALKLAESEVLRDILKKDPVILLDDVMSELDKNRKQYILSRLKDSQCFITCCDKAYFENTKAGSIYKIDDLIM